MFLIEIEDVKFHSVEAFIFISNSATSVNWRELSDSTLTGNSMAVAKIET